MTVIEIRSILQVISEIDVMLPRDIQAHLLVEFPFESDMSNEEVTDVVKKLIGQIDANLIVNELYKESILRWKLKDQGIDDITIICVLLKTS